MRLDALEKLDYAKIKRYSEFFLGALALIGIFLFLQLRMSSELADPDIWLHLKTGEYIVQHQAVPQLDAYSIGASGKIWIDHSSLTQVIYYWLFNSNGPDGLIIFSAVLMLLAFLFLFLCVYKGNYIFSLSITMLAVTVFASGIRFNIRPENFSVLFFCAYLFILTRYKNKVWIFLLPLIQIIWVNCHGFSILGPLATALFISAEKLKSQIKLPWEWANCQILDKKSYRNLIIVFVLSVFALLVNPYGIKLVLYPLTVISDTIFKPGFAYDYIVELFPVWKLRFGRMAPYYALLGISSASFLFNFRKINFTYLLIWLALLAASFNISRNIIFFNCIACIAAVDNFSRIDYRKLLGRVLPDNFVFLLKCIALASIIVISARYNRQMLNDDYYIFSQQRFKSSLLGEASDIYPNKAADFILKNKLPDKLFNHFNYGSYLVYRLYPQHHVFIDGRTELYNEEFFYDYHRILYVDTATIDQLLIKYGINMVVISSSEIYDLEKLIKYLNRKQEWVLVYLDENGVIFIRAAKENSDLVKQLRVVLDKWEINKADVDKIGLRRVYPVPHLRLAQMLYALGAAQKAELQAKEALNILPSSADAYIVLGRIYLDKVDFKQAYQYLRLASIYAPDRMSTLNAWSDYYLKTKDGKNTEKVLKRIVKINPRYAEGYYNLGIYYENSGDFKSAIKYLRKATKLAPYSTEYLNKFLFLSNLT